jgi:hypothetical protein
MKLYDILPRDGEEYAVSDNAYDSEYYFYFSDNEDQWDIAMMELAKKLTMTGDHEVNLSELIENKINLLGDLFIDCDIDSIMDDMENILSGNVSEKWLTDFVDIL